MWHVSEVYREGLCVVVTTLIVPAARSLGSIRLGHMLRTAGTNIPFIQLRVSKHATISIFINRSAYI